MVYTKHFPIRTFDTLKKSEKYIKNAEKTIENNSSDTTHLDNLFSYIAANDKTLHKQLVSTHGIIDVNNAYNEFKFTKMRFEEMKQKNFKFNSKTGNLEPPSLKDLENKNSVLARHLIQSFSPEDNLTPEQVHEIGRKTVLEFTGGDYEFVIATHVDKGHIHNHIILNTTNIIDGKSLEWKLPKGKNGKTKDVSKERFEKVSDKIASAYGAKIIEKSPKNSHLKYTRWQTESIFKEKIKSRLNFLMKHSSSLDDFMKKASALNLECDFSGKWATYKLLDEPQIRPTRSRNINKSDPTRYNLESIKEKLKTNDVHFTIEDVVNRYEEIDNKKVNDFDYQMTIEDWQISHKTDRGYYLNLDFGFGSRGQVFIGAYKVDALENGDYNIYFKNKDFFYFMNEKNSKDNKYITGATILKQLRLYNGQVPLKKEPIMSTIDEIVEAINFLADNDVTEGRQLGNLENKLELAFDEAEATLDKLDEKIMTLNNLSKLLLESETSEDKERIQEKLEKILPDASLSDLTFTDIKDEVAAIVKSRNILEQKINQTVKEINQVRNIKAVSEKENTQTLHPKI